jgi:altronate dehydratase
MDTPSFDVLSITGFVAGGCQIIVFTTGVGTPFGNAITPVIKVISNTPAYNRMKDNTDINAGTIL